MIPGQFQIPTSSEGSNDPEILYEIDLPPVPVESAEDIDAYTFVKMIEADIERLHDTATEANLPKQTAIERVQEALANLTITNTIPRSLKDKLTNIESTISTSKLPVPPDAVGHRFWFHDGDWFYEVQYPSSVVVARYQFTDGTAHKLVEGKPIAFEVDEQNEIDNLLKMIPLYHQTIQLELYSNKDDYDLAA